MTYAEKIEYGQLEEQIDQLESQKTKLNQQMTQVPGNDFSQLADLQQQIDQLDIEIDQKMNRWDELSQFA